MRITVTKHSKGSPLETVNYIEANSFWRVRNGDLPNRKKYLHILLSLLLSVYSEVVSIRFYLILASF